MTKTAKALKISVQTLYKWRGEASTQPSDAEKAQGHQAKKNKGKLDARAILENDRNMEQKIAQLEAENLTLRTSLTKDRAALAAVLGESN